jgi:hypothetical protein
MKTQFPVATLVALSLNLAGFITCISKLAQSFFIEDLFFAVFSVIFWCAVAGIICGLSLDMIATVKKN